MWSREFWKAATDRALKSAAQSLLLLWGSDQVLNILDVDPLPAAGIAAGAAVLSVLTSIVSAPVGDRGTTSLLPGAEQPALGRW